MLADRKLGALMCGFVACGCGVAYAAEEEPDAEFLEYLGLWEGSDEDWLIIEDSMAAEKEQHSDPLPDGEESPEKDDER